MFYSLQDKFNGNGIRGWCLGSFVLLSAGCTNGHPDTVPAKDPVRLIVLAPGHFHAALLQKSMYPQVDSSVYVYAPEGEDLQAYLSLVKMYNSREKDPTAWKENVYAGPDFLDKMLREKKGNMVILAGNNKDKTDYLAKSVAEGLNVLTDKPMVISKAGFERLQSTFELAAQKKVFLYDIMTSRFEITNILQKELSQLSDIFGMLQQGSLERPAVVSESVHHFLKSVSGKPLIRPAWYFDVQQQGEGIVDVTTHMVDLVQWMCFPDQVLNYKTDIVMHTAKRWPTVLTPAQFTRVTNQQPYPAFLKDYVKDSLLNVYANGEMNYSIKKVHARISVAWQFEPPPGGDDINYSLLRGTQCDLVIRQGKDQQYKPVLYIEPAHASADSGWERSLHKGIQTINEKYPGVSVKKEGKAWMVVIPESLQIGHEQQFSLVVSRFLQYLEEKKVPDWEVSGMLTKYYTTTAALEKALGR